MYAQTIIVLVKHWPDMIVQSLQECRRRRARFITDLLVLWHFTSSLHLLYRGAAVYEFQLYEFCTEDILQSRAAPYQHVQGPYVKSLSLSFVCLK